MIQDLELVILGKLLLAGLFGAAIGLERELRAKPAGLRTNAFVALAAALLVSLGEILVDRLDEKTAVIRTDPLRIIEAIITGISFLGAGTIIFRKSDNTVEGMTTAASILLAGAIGIAVALDRFVLAGGVTLIALLILQGLGRLERRIGPTR